MICIRCEQEISGKAYNAIPYEEHISAEEPDADRVEVEEGDKICYGCAVELRRQGKDYDGRNY